MVCCRCLLVALYRVSFVDWLFVFCDFWIVCFGVFGVSWRVSLWYFFWVL